MASMKSRLKDDFKNLWMPDLLESDTVRQFSRFRAEAQPITKQKPPAPTFDVMCGQISTLNQPPAQKMIAPQYLLRGAIVMKSRQHTVTYTAYDSPSSFQVASGEKRREWSCIIVKSNEK
mmetsp:Transcript_117268/g.203730  ORF Transcript_117268/g.203730 Transcript_117268/m.203730 type:complete len:120 (+) Transcript_117268:236-595(+)